MQQPCGFLTVLLLPAFAGLADEPTALNRDRAIVHSVIEPAGPDMPRADTASVVELPDRKLWVVYHKYEAGKNAGRDHGLCRVWSRTSHDGGRTWIEPRLLVDVAPGDMNVQAPAALRLPSGDLIMICLRAHGNGSSSSMCLFRSRDDGKSFIEEAPVWRQSQGQWLQGGASSLVLLESGRILLPFHGGTGNQWKQRNSIGCFVSDDFGRVWSRARASIELPKRGAMEASVAELADGELVMSIRTQLGGPYLSRSRDGGETWTEAKPSGLEGSESCTCLRRIPGTDTLLLLWNNSEYIPTHHHFGERTPLTAAVSSDAGKTWRIVGDIAAGPRDEYTNLDCTFTTTGRAVVTYMFGTPAWNRNQLSLRAAVIEPEWFKVRTAPAAKISKESPCNHSDEPCPRTPPNNQHR